jgi:hypothetical protein
MDHRGPRRNDHDMTKPNRIQCRRWLPPGRVARRSRGLVLGGVWLRCVTRLRARDLDRDLAAGADPIGSDELSLRVGQLAAGATRVRLARVLHDAVAVANGRHPPLTVTRLQRATIRDNQELLLALADRVRDGGVVGVRGLAMVSELLEDRSGPLYAADTERPLAVTALEALVELDRGLRTTST